MNSSLNHLPPSRWHVDFFLIAGICFTLLKHFLLIHLPIEARHYSVDDLLMVQMAESLIRGQWLGEYSALTLMKGCFFPMFLALINKLNLSYLSTLDWLYSSACFLFVWEMRHIINRRSFHLLLYVVLLFNPCSFSLTNYQRVYRSSIILIQVLFLFAIFFGYYFFYRHTAALFTERSQSVPIWYAIGAGFILWSLWNTREDSIWLLPFIITASLLIIREIIVLSKKLSQPSKFVLSHMLILFIPCVILVSGNQMISYLNEKNYGESIRLEVADGNFARALKTVYSIKNKENVPYTTVSHEKLIRLFTYSPTLALIRPQLEQQMEYYDAIDRNGKDGEVEDGWFYWGLKKASYESGIADTLSKSQDFWSQVALELQQAVLDPSSDLELQQIMPSSLMSPWKQEYWNQLIPTTMKSIGYIISFKDVTPSVQASGKAGLVTTRRFEMITNDFALYSEGFPDSQIQDECARMQPIYTILIRIVHIYQGLNKPILVFSLCAYLFLLFRYIQLRKKELVPCLLIPLGMSLSIIVLSAGTAYTDISAFPSIKCFYLAGAYPLMLASEWIALICALQELIDISDKN